MNFTGLDILRLVSSPNEVLNLGICLRCAQRNRKEDGAALRGNSASQPHWPLKHLKSVQTSELRHVFQYSELVSS